jgi:hypothetical protein
MWIAALFVLGWIFFTAGVAPADDAGTADGLVREAQKLYFNGKTAEADETLKKAEELLPKALEGADPASVSKAKTVAAKAAKLRKDIDRKLGRGAGSPPAAVEKAAGGAPPAGPAMPSFVVSRLKGITSSINNAKEWLDKGSVRSARNSLNRAVDEMKEIEERYAGKFPPDHPDVASVKENLHALEQAVAAEEAKAEAVKAGAAARAAQAAKESEEWIERLKPYATGSGQPGHDPKRYFIGGFTEEEAEMNRRAALFPEVRNLMAEYREKGPGEDASDSLKEIVRQLEYQLSSFTDSLKSAGETYLREAGTQIDFLHRRAQEESAKIGTGTAPIPLSQDAVGRSKQLLDRAARILGDNAPQIIEMRTKYDRTFEMDGRIRTARLSETRMLPDRFSGKDAGEIRDKAAAVLQGKKPGIRILRTTLIHPDWTEESVIEWTDTTHSALRHRTTRFLTAQAAGKLGNETKIYTIYVAKDRRTDGSWSPLYGHVMYEDPILEENVNK